MRIVLFVMTAVMMIGISSAANAGGRHHNGARAAHAIGHAVGHSVRHLGWYGHRAHRVRHHRRRHCFWHKHRPRGFAHRHCRWL